MTLFGQRRTCAREISHDAVRILWNCMITWAILYVHPKLVNVWRVRDVVNAFVFCQITCITIQCSVTLNFKPRAQNAVCAFLNRVRVLKLNVFSLEYRAARYNISSPTIHNDTVRWAYADLEQLKIQTVHCAFGWFCAHFSDSCLLSHPGFVSSVFPDHASYEACVVFVAVYVLQFPIDSRSICCQRKPTLMVLHQHF